MKKRKLAEISTIVAIRTPDDSPLKFKLIISRKVNNVPEVLPPPPLSSALINESVSQEDEESIEDIEEYFI